MVTKPKARNGMTAVKHKSKQGVTVAEFLANQIAISGKSQKEIADELGYDKANIITMFKQGLTKLPVYKVKLMAQSLGIDPIRLMNIVMNEYMPEAWAAIQEVIGIAVTENEREIINELRNITKDSDPKMITSDQKQLLKEFARSLK